MCVIYIVMVKTQKRKYRKQKKVKTRRRKQRKIKTRRRKNKKRSSRRRKMKGGAYECLNCLNEIRELIRISNEIKSELLKYYGKKDRGVNILKVMKTIDNLVNEQLHPLLSTLQESKMCRECFEKEPKFNISEYNELLGLILEVLQDGEIYNVKKDKYVKLDNNKQALVHLMQQVMILLKSTESHIRKKIDVKAELRKRIEARKKHLSSPLVRPESPLTDEILKFEGPFHKINENSRIKKILDEETKKIINNVSPITIDSDIYNATSPSTPEGMFKPIDTDSD